MAELPYTIRLKIIQFAAYALRSPEVPVSFLATTQPWINFLAVNPSLDCSAEEIKDCFNDILASLTTDQLLWGKDDSVLILLKQSKIPLSQNDQIKCLVSSTSSSWQYCSCELASTTTTTVPSTTTTTTGGTSTTSTTTTTRPSTTTVVGNTSPAADQLWDINFYYNWWFGTHAFCADSACVTAIQSNGIGYDMMFGKGTLGKAVSESAIAAVRASCTSGSQNLRNLGFTKSGRQYIHNLDGSGLKQGWVSTVSGACGATVPIRRWKSRFTDDMMYATDLEWNTWYNQMGQDGGQPVFYLWK